MIQRFKVWKFGGSWWVHARQNWYTPNPTAVRFDTLDEAMVQIAMLDRLLHGTEAA